MEDERSKGRGVINRQRAFSSIPSRDGERAKEKRRRGMEKGKEKSFHGDEGLVSFFLLLLFVFFCFGCGLVLVSESAPNSFAKLATQEQQQQKAATIGIGAL